MLNAFRSKLLPAVLSICLLLAVMILVGGCDQDTEPLPAYRVKGPMKVYYMVQNSVPGSSGTGSNGLEAKEIIMFEKYVIIKNKNGSTTLLPIDKIKSLIWQ